jgi:hypothetical protein
MITSQSISYNYRICEIIFNPNPFPSHLQEMILTHYPDSILSNYINKTKNNFHLLQFIKTVGNCSISSLYTGHNLFLEKIFYYLYESILDTFPNFNPLYTIPTHAFHCRVGDVLDFCLHHSVDDHLIAGGCFREDQDPSKSLSYLKKIENHFLFLGCSVYSRYNFNPDEDLLFLLNSKYYTSGGGRFGELVYYFRKFLNSLSR